MEREERVRSMVMDAIADDYEDLQTVVGDVSSWASEEGVALTPGEILDALTGLIDAGLAKAYHLDPNCAPQPLQGYAPGCYFLLTDKGKAQACPKES